MPADDARSLFGSDPSAGHITQGETALEYRWIPPTAADAAPVLVFLHEGLGCVAAWRSFPDRVAQRTGCGAFVFSRAGYGASSPITLPRPLDYMQKEAIDVLPGLLRRLAFSRVLFVGHSDGASIALIYAGGESAQAGEPIVDGVVAMAPHVFNEALSVASIRAAAADFVKGDLREKLKRVHGRNVDCAFWGWNRAWLDPGFAEWNIESYLPAIHAPVLVIQGADDQYGTPAQYQAIQTQCGGPVQVLELQQCGHAPHREQQEQTLDSISAFVNQCRGRSSSEA